MVSEKAMQAGHIVSAVTTASSATGWSAVPAVTTATGRDRAGAGRGLPITMMRAVS